MKNRRRNDEKIKMLLNKISIASSGAHAAACP
jgi:hypothetical protein